MSPTVARFALANGLNPGVNVGAQGRAVTDHYGAIIQCKLPIDIRTVIWLGIDPSGSLSQALR